MTLTACAQQRAVVLAPVRGETAPADTRWGVRGFQGGYNFGDVRVNGTAVQPRINDTMMRLDLPTPLLPRGGKTTISIRYLFRVPEHGSDRMGRDSALYEIAQWYP